MSDRIDGLDGGADDYITKPFSFEELLARVRARLRGELSKEATVLHAGDASLDLRTRRAVIDGGTIDLSGREFALAHVFFRHPGQVLSREQFLSHVWGYDFDPGSNVVDVYFGYPRRKLGKDRIASWATGSRAATAEHDEEGRPWGRPSRLLVPLRPPSG